MQLPVIELHARFLEMNFLSQIRALPNPASPGNQSVQHPLTLHLTPTSTVNVLVTSLTPAPPASQPFVKISPDAEVIVAPKARQQQSSRSSNRENRSVASTGRKSMRSTTSTVRHRSIRSDENMRHPVFLRAVDRQVVDDWFDEETASCTDDGLRVWVDRPLLLSKTLKGVTWAAVSIIKPASLQEPIDPSTAPSEADQPAQRVVAKLCAWDDAPDGNHAALSSMLCASLGSVGIVGGIVRIEAAPPQLPRTTSAMKQPTKEAKEVVVKSLRISPFVESLGGKPASLKFGGESEKEKEAALRRIKSLFSGSEDGSGLLDGPITDGMILPAEAGKAVDHRWPGGILRFDPQPSTGIDSLKKPVHWLLGSERKLNIDIQPEISKPLDLAKGGPGDDIPAESPTMVGIDKLILDLGTNLQRSSSILLTGGLGSGKTSLAQLLAHQLRNEDLFHTIYFGCKTLMTDETRVSTIKETLQRIFGSASWGARLGGRSLIVLDDLDKLCPVETELQVGGDNGRSRQISELLCSIARQHCSRDSGVVLLATAQAKESVNNVIIGGHIVRDIVSLKAPNKDGRRRVLEMLVHEKESKPKSDKTQSNDNGHPWMDGDSIAGSVNDDSNGFVIDPAIDLLDVAGQTDGYMPGDLNLLVSRAQSEALIRSISSEPTSTDTAIILTQSDFASALKGFTPASLRNVTLQSSTTTFSSIGGLKETRQTLLETLQYPTTYAPIFAKCPLRLRSGLLLYGYPGCGKTMLASAVAGECGLNFISVKGPEILNKYIGASEKSVRDLFDRAEAARPCVLFFDEFDSIAPKRGHDSTGVTDRVVNQLLTQMDGAEGLSGVYVLAATSRPDLIDPALLRPGRLDKSLLCDMPDLDDRLDILRAVTNKLKIAPGILDGEDDAGHNLKEVAKRTQGYSGADLQAVMYNAHLEAIHDVLGPADMEQELGQGKSKDGSKNSGRPKDFTYFRFGDDDTGTADAGVAANGQSASIHAAAATAAKAAERAAIASKLAQMEAAKRRARQQRAQAFTQNTKPVFPLAANGAGAARTSENDEDDEEHGDDGDEAGHGSQEPVIGWRHILASLEQTRPSISRQEVGRLKTIYREFIVGRNGEMGDGAPGNEIGGRSSLA